MISDDYIPYENIPESSGGNKPDRGSYTKSAYFNNVLNDYTGSASITDARIKALNNDYYTKNYSSSNNNMRSVAYMLDTNAWSGYAGEKAEYAVGGPTIEMLMASYSEKYGVDYRARASNSTGYQISNNGGSSWAYSYSNMLSTSDRTYVINSTSNAYGMWVASPCAYSTDVLMYVRYSGYVINYGYSRLNLGFRPLVCLKSDTKLVKNEDGSFTIANN